MYFVTYPACHSTDFTWCDWDRRSGRRHSCLSAGSRDAFLMRARVVWVGRHLRITDSQTTWSLAIFLYILPSWQLCSGGQVEETLNKARTVEQIRRHVGIILEQCSELWESGHEDVTLLGARGVLGLLLRYTIPWGTALATTKWCS